VQPFFFQLLEDLREATAQGVAMVGEGDGPTKYAHDILYVNIIYNYIYIYYVVCVVFQSKVSNEKNNETQLMKPMGAGNGWFFEVL
jgi:hypothetical protein